MDFITRIRPTIPWTITTYDSMITTPSPAMIINKQPRRTIISATNSEQSGVVQKQPQAVEPMTMEQPAARLRGGCLPCPGGCCCCIPIPCCC
ncbi:hypothetical protein DFP72DRAFT_923092 [Ephemerocybe angulata]|uniref:Uncharacterized protein n=1 Tax=Ephemerocybe angulata TaxID=980116 RepID=A0A8H6HFW1_9AGAR|nr:hypothetical protein DFP72DRAFT_923092 [Tulosesus angulatus]